MKKSENEIEKIIIEDELESFQSKKKDETSEFSLSLNENIQNQSGSISYNRKSDFLYLVGFGLFGLLIGVVLCLFLSGSIISLAFVIASFLGVGPVPFYALSIGGSLISILIPCVLCFVGALIGKCILRYELGRRETLIFMQQSNHQNVDSLDVTSMISNSSNYTEKTSLLIEKDKKSEANENFKRLVNDVLKRQYVFELERIDSNTLIIQCSNTKEDGQKKKFTLDSLKKRLCETVDNLDESNFSSSKENELQIISLDSVLNSIINQLKSVTDNKMKPEKKKLSFLFEESNKNLLEEETEKKEIEKYSCRIS